MPSTFDYVALGLAALVAAPAIIFMSPVIVVALIIAVLVGAYGTREGLDIFKARQFGAAGNDRKGQSLDQLRSDNSDSSAFRREGKN